MITLQMSATSRRLLPLYISAFLQGIPFWYAIEKLFMLEIGFTTASIGLMVAIMSTVMLIVEAPSGILADRWSRKGVIILGAVSLALAGIIGALSFNEPTFILSTVFWGVYAALYSGTFDAVIYDTIIEEEGKSTRFQAYVGRLRAIEGASFVIGALLGGVIASQFSMRATFALSIPVVLASIYFVWRFQEPQLHKAEVSDPVFKHIRQTFAAVLRNPVLLPVIVAIIGFSVLLDTIFELSQLWFIAVLAPVALYGVFSALVFSTWTVGGIMAGRINSPKLTKSVLGLTLFSILGLILARNYWVILLTQFALTACLVALTVILTQKLHDELPSKLRAGSASVVSTIARLILIPTSLVFTALAYKTTIYSATYILFGFALIATVAYIFIPYAKHRQKN